MSSLGDVNRTDVFNQAAPGANTDILATALSPARFGVFRVTVELAVASIFNVTTTRSGTTFTGGLNGSVALGAGDRFTFTFGVSPLSTYNFQVETDGIIRVLQIDEIYGGVI